MGIQNAQFSPALAPCAVARQACLEPSLIRPSPDVVRNSPDTRELQSIKFNHAFSTIDQAKTLEQALPGVNVLLQAFGYAPRAIANNSRPDEGAGSVKQPCTSLEHQRDAAGDPAKQRVLAGEPVDRVAGEQGIEKGSVAYHMLEDIAVEGPAKARILAGEPVGHVAGAHGIEKDSLRYQMLEDIAAEGPAKMRILAGEPLDLVASMHGIEKDGDPYRMLEDIALERQAKVRILAGERVDQVAGALAIERGSGLYCMLERVAAEGPAKA